MCLDSHRASWILIAYQSAVTRQEPPLPLAPHWPAGWWPSHIRCVSRASAASSPAAWRAPERIPVPGSQKRNISISTRILGRENTHTSSTGSRGNTNFLTGSHKLHTVLHSESIRVFPFLPEIGNIACGPGDSGQPASPAYMPAPHTPDRSKDVTPALGKHSQT